MNQQFSPDERPDGVTSGVLEEHLRSVYQAVRETTPPYSAPISEVVPLVQRRTLSNARTLGFSVAASIALITIGITARAVLNSPGHKAKVTPAAQESSASADSHITFTAADLQTPGFFVPKLVPEGQDPNSSSFEPGFIDPVSGKTYRPFAGASEGTSIPANVGMDPSVDMGTGTQLVIGTGTARLLGEFTQPDRPDFYMSVFLADSAEALDGMQGMTSEGVTPELEGVQPLVKYRDPFERGWTGYRMGSGSVQIAVIGNEIAPADLEALDEFVTNTGSTTDEVLRKANDVAQAGGLVFGEVLPFSMAGYIRNAVSTVPLQTGYLTEYTIDGVAPKEGDMIYQFRQVFSFSVTAQMEQFTQLASGEGIVAYAMSPLRGEAGEQMFIGQSQLGYVQPNPSSEDLTLSTGGVNPGVSLDISIIEGLDLVPLEPKAFVKLLKTIEVAEAGASGAPQFLPRGEVATEGTLTTDAVSPAPPTLETSSTSLQ